MNRSIVSKPRLLALWLFPMDLSLKKISPQEEEWGNQLPAKRSKVFKYSRSYARFALSNLFKVDPIEIPLIASPGAAPILKKGYGSISMSHTNEFLLIGWSKTQIGVDIEQKDRSFESNKLVGRYFKAQEKKLLEGLNKREKSEAILANWVGKEAAIKWHKGSLFKDITHWELNNHLSLATNSELRDKVNIKIIKYGKCIIGIAFKQEISNHQILICQH